jgi:hypothetical protein
VNATCATSEGFTHTIDVMVKPEEIPDHIEVDVSELEINYSKHLSDIKLPPGVKAISRVDLVCRNSASQSADVTLHLDLSGDGKRTDYDTKPESGMKLRDFEKKETNSIWTD